MNPNLLYFVQFIFFVKIPIKFLVLKPKITLAGAVEDLLNGAGGVSIC